MNIPTKVGIYKWKDERGGVHDLEVCDVGTDFGNGHETMLRVFWKGGYYKLTPEEYDLEDECWPQEGWL